MKKFIVIALIFVAVVAITTFFFSRKSPTTTPQGMQPTPTPMPAVVQPLPITPMQNQASETTFVFSFVPPQLPDRLPSYSIRRRDYLSEATRVASSLGFTLTPVIAHEISSTYYTWSSPGKQTLTYQETPPSLSYWKSISVSTGSATKEEAQGVMNSFLQTNGLLDQTITPVLTDSVYLASVGNNMIPARGVSDATYVNLSYAYAVGTFPLFADSSALPAITALVASGGNIKSFSISLFPTFLPLAQTPIVPLSDAVTALQNNKGVLIGVSKNDHGETSSDAMIKFVTITRVQLGYYFDTKRGTLSPVYVFSGTAQDPTSSSLLTVVYLVAASL